VYRFHALLQKHLIKKKKKEKRKKAPYSFLKRFLMKPKNSQCFAMKLNLECFIHRPIALAL